MAINSKRLLKLADFLDELPPSHFDFTKVRVTGQKTEHNECGTVGCAVGWCPTVFPRACRITKMFKSAWEPNVSRVGRMNVDGKSMLVDIGSHGEIADRLFSLPIGHGFALFTHEEMSPASGSELPASATPKQVAARIRTYVKWSKKIHAVAK